MRASYATAVFSPYGRAHREDQANRATASASLEDIAALVGIAALEGDAAAPVPLVTQAANAADPSTRASFANWVAKLQALTKELARLGSEDPVGEMLWILRHGNITGTTLDRAGEGPIGEPVTIAVVGATALISWLSAAVASIGVSLGISATFVATAMAALTTAGISMTVAGANKLVEELDDNETPEAKFTNAFYAEKWDDRYTSEEAVIQFIADLRKQYGDKIATLCGLKVWSRYWFVHSPAEPFIRAGIIANKQEIIAAVHDLAVGQSADAKYTSEFYSEQWDHEYTSEDAVLKFIVGLQHRQGHRAGLQCGLKVWNRWKLLLEPRIKGVPPGVHAAPPAVPPVVYTAAPSIGSRFQAALAAKKNPAATPVATVAAASKLSAVHASPKMFSLVASPKLSSAMEARVEAIAPRTARVMHSEGSVSDWGEPAEDPRPKPRRSLTIPLVIGAVALTAAGGGALWWLHSSNKE